MIIEVFDETDEEAPDTWSGGVPTFECPYRHVDLDRFWPLCGVYFTPMELVYHIQMDHPQHVDLDTGTTQDVDLDLGTIQDVDLDG